MRGWYVTSALHGDRRLAGPYDYERCQVECLKRTDAATVRRYLVAGVIPQLYVPRQFEIPPSVAAALQPYIKEQPARDARLTAETKASTRPEIVHSDRSAILPQVIYSYTRGSLLLLCDALLLPKPPLASGRSGIIEHIEAELLKLAPRGAWKAGAGGEPRRRRRARA